MYRETSKSSYLSVVCHDNQLYVLSHLEGLSLMLSKRNTDLIPLYASWASQDTVTVSGPKLSSPGQL